MADDAEISFRTRIDQEGLDRGLQEVDNKVNKHTKKTQNNLDKASKSSGKFNTVLKEVSGTASGFADKMSSVAAAGGPYVAAAVAAVGVTKKLCEGIRETSEALKVQEKAERALETAAMNNPYLNKSSVERLKEFASSLQSIGNVGDEEMLRLMAPLAAADRTVDEIENIVSAAMELSAGSTMSLESAIVNLGKTYSGLAGELGESIPQIRALTAEQLKNGEAVKVIAEKYKGMAAATADARIQAQNAKGDFKEAIGEITKPTADAWDNFWKGFYEKGIQAINWIDEKLDKLSMKSTEKDIRNSINTVYTNKETGEQKDGVEFLSDEQIDQWIKYYEEIEEKTKGMSEAQIENLRNMTRGASQQFLLNSEQKQALILLKSERTHRKNVVEEQKRATEEAEKQKKLEEEKAQALEDQKKKIAEMKAMREKDAADHKEQNKTNLEKNLKRLELEAELTGEAASAQDKYNIYLQSYIDLVTTTKNVTEKNDLATTRKKQLEDAKKDLDEAIANEERLQLAIEKTKEATDAIQGMVKELSPAESVKDQVNAIDEVIAHINELSDAEVEEAQKGAEVVYSKQELLENLAELEKQITIDKVNEIASIEKSDYERRKEENEDLLELKKQLAEDEILTAEEKAAAINKIDEKIANNSKQTAADTASTIKGYVDQSVQIMKDATDLMLQTVQWQSDAELATLEKKYLTGEIGEEEYEKKKLDAKKKAAKEEYKLRMWQWSASILQATANIAEGVSKAIAQGGVAGLITGAIVAAAGGVQLASVIASKPIPPNYATGGIVGGNSYTGDKVQANVNSGEMILNAHQQRALWDVANGKNAGSSSPNIVINNSAANLVTARPTIDKDKIELMIDARVNDSLRKGRFNQGLNMATQSMDGDYYGL